MQEDTVSEQLFEGRRPSGLDRSSALALLVGLVLGGALSGALPVEERGYLDLTASCLVETSGIPRLDVDLRFGATQPSADGSGSDPVLVIYAEAPGSWIPFSVAGPGRAEITAEQQGLIRRWMKSNIAHPLGIYEAVDVREGSLTFASVSYESDASVDLTIRALMIDADASTREDSTSINCPAGGPPPDGESA